MKRIQLYTRVGNKKDFKILFGTNFAHFFLALSNLLNLAHFPPSKFIWKSKAPYKIKTFVWSVANKMVNTNDLLQVRNRTKPLVLPID